MIITQESVHEAEELVASSGVHYEVNPGQRKAIFWASPVNIGKVNAESPLSICLLDENHISQPVGIVYFSNSLGLEEFVDLFVLVASSGVHYEVDPVQGKDVFQASLINIGKVNVVISKRLGARGPLWARLGPMGFNPVEAREAQAS